MVSRIQEWAEEQWFNKPQFEDAEAPVRFKQLGPYPVDYTQYETMNSDTGLMLGPVLSPRTIILNAWLEAQTPWLVSGLSAYASLSVRLNTVADPEVEQGLNNYDVVEAQNNPQNVANVEINPGGSEGRLPCRVKEDAHVLVRSDVETTWTQGQSDLYLLISEPV